ncbi:ATP-binding cassette domain-containing protein [Aquibacillus halophilus]|uniref:ATP-binding cassette domain-containing protein n=1 Tax=Aquibacillus halophilus TaxID=930132 RepID=A0A6A8D9E3_9BACI|nr:sugar ABC transporter ATP-binding protein [Aquibacillus halophilus]MRH41156.1 ATP-binding cassette domain-containing protein [Aquibacillus halophilus]
MVAESKRLLNIEGVSKSFSGVTVFSDFDFDIYEGEVHCLCGENGAGKSTFIKILSGAHLPDGGKVVINGEEVDDKYNPSIAMKLGVQTIYQEHTLMQNLTVMENLFVGKEIVKRGVVDREEMYKQSLDVLHEIGVDTIDPSSPVRELGTAQQKFVQIAKAFVGKAKIMIMDEPTASFGIHEIEQLLNIVGFLKSQGIGVLYISHHLEEVFRIADRVTVIRDGEKIRTYKKDEINQSSIIKDMVGRDTSMMYKRDTVDIGEVVMEVNHVSGPGVEDVSFNLRKGEIVGFAGLVGAGRTELAELLFARKKLTSGEILINGKKTNFKTPKDAIKAGMCMITEDRQLSGLFLNQSISLNTILVHSSKNDTKIMDPKKEDSVSSEYIDKLKTKCTGPDQKVRFLSGGNQQKVILSKWFYAEGDIFIFDEPTRGVDIGAKEEIYQLMVELCNQGKAIIMISSDMPEVIAMSDRVIIMNKGKKSAEIDKDKINSETILSYALGGTV